MSESVESYESACTNIAVTMLAACSRFRDRAGATDATDARGFIIEEDSGGVGSNDGRIGMGTAVSGGKIDLNKPFYAIIGMPDGVSSEAGGVGYPDRDFVVAIRLVHHRITTGEDAPDAARRVKNDTGTIRAQLEAQQGSATAFADFDVSTSGLFRDEEGGVRKDHTITEITITVRG